MSDMCLVDKRELATLRVMARKAGALVKAHEDWKNWLDTVDIKRLDAIQEEYVKEELLKVTRAYDELMVTVILYNNRVAKYGRDTKSQILTSLDKKNGA